MHRAHLRILNLSPATHTITAQKINPIPSITTMRTSIFARPFISIQHASFINRIPNNRCWHCKPKPATLWIHWMQHRYRPHLELTFDRILNLVLLFFFPFKVVYESTATILAYGYRHQRTTTSYLVTVQVRMKPQRS